MRATGFAGNQFSGMAKGVAIVEYVGETVQAHLDDDS
jgi:hypothetical protein